ncbi:DnaD domain-containing protein [Enterococcus pallens]|uniref:DnaD domain-containing protein n=1 Tax=Enterococcus pallens ATCC BAA-351 TaxID=1158607 RepID=R2S1M6_9ENTE|nr:DnaD domain protein [Enterococcus pallens]EOH86731.1 DnaD domain-containing protein [Enterococcus pallens ATCC BAA-351]EOU18527.1 hypothetical protein I588_03522 [Enterococcus pallens ATCC BAA-351]OJG76544.1 DnaD domain-containing protein [Enterococcus pallens]
MDYIRQINAFENLNEYNEIGPGAQLLWYKLMRVANLSGWQNELSISNTRLQSMTKTSEKTLINNRNQLIQTGLLQYKKRGRTKAGIYILTDLTGKFPAKTTVNNIATGNFTVDSTVNRKVNPSVDSSVDSTVDSTVDTSAYINKTKQDKTKNNIASEYSDNSNSEQTAVSYWLNQVNPAEAPFITQSIQHWVQDFNGQDDIVIAAIDDMLQNGARNYKYLDKILKTWESLKLDTPQKVSKHLAGHYHKKVKAKFTNYGQTLYTYYQQELRFSPKMTFEDYVERKRLNERDKIALEQYIKSLEGTNEVS